MPPVLTYCDTDTFLDRSTYVVDDTVLLTKVMARAEKQVDEKLSGWGPNLAGGLAVDPDVDLDAEERECLEDAVIAQTEYRLSMGEEFFRTNEPDSMSGPDYSRSGKLGKFADEAWSALRRGGLVEQWTSSSSRGR
jgi:hypothetical protein